MANRFENHVVWITGGGSGIGQAVALQFAREGATVAVSGRRKDRLDEVVGEIEALGGAGFAQECDVTDEASVAAAVAAVVAACGKIDVAIANAGFSVAGRVEKLTAEDWRRQFNVNVVGLAMTAKHALPELRKHNGRLVLVGSVASMIASPGVGAYSASKYAVRAIGQTLSVELHGSGVTCTTIHPGFVESEIAKVDNKGSYHPDAKDGRPAKLMWTSERAAKVMLGAIHRRKREFVFTGHGKIGAFIGVHMPKLAHFAMTRNASKGGFAEG